MAGGLAACGSFVSIGHSQSWPLMPSAVLSPSASRPSNSQPEGKQKTAKGALAKPARQHKTRYAATAAGLLDKMPGLDGLLAYRLSSY